MRFLCNFFILMCTLTILMSVASKASSVTFGEVQLRVNGNVHTLEYANTFEKRALGLMHRQSLCDTCGMLFKFETPKVAGFWMKDTLIPLDIAFVREDGVITDIKQMKALDLNSTVSSQSVLYAWEMNKDWFAKNNVKEGDTVSLSLSH